MEDEEIWQAIRSTVESGVETPKIDLKSDLSLNQALEKAEFVKDVIAIANVSGNVGYIVIGVKERKNWQFLVYEVCKKLYDMLPEEKREEEIKLFFTKHDKEEDYDKWFYWMKKILIFSK